MEKKKLLFLMTAIALFVPSVMAAELTAGTDAELKNALFQDTNNTYGVEVTFEGTINVTENGITILIVI